MNRQEFIAHVNRLKRDHPDDLLLAEFSADGPLGHYWPNNRIRDEIAATHAAAGEDAADLERYAHMAAALGDREGAHTPLADLRIRYYSELTAKLAAKREGVSSKA